MPQRASGVLLHPTSLPGPYGVGDLGAESIDFLDIVFRLEKAFDIKIPRGELFPENIAQAESGLMQDGKVTPAGGAQGQPTNPTLTWTLSSGAVDYEYCYDTIDNGACDTSWVPVGNATSGQRPGPRS